MWFFSHASVGYFSTMVLVKREERTRTVMVLGTISGMLPDSDVLLKLWSDQTFIAYHRTISHSLAFGFVASLIIYTIMCPLYSRRVFLTFFVAELSHLFIDCFMDSHYPFGIALLWPISDYLFNFQILDWLFGFGFVTSDRIYFIVSVITFVITILLAQIFLEREKKYVSSFSSPTQKSIIK